MPFLDAAQVSGPALVVDDEGYATMAQALLHHDQPAEAAVAVFEGMDMFEADMEVQDVPKVVFFLGLIFLNQSVELLGDLLRGKTILMWTGTEFSSSHGAVPVSLCAIKEKAM